ncbi:NADH-ubiquinone oxidoreductase-F iron-sulfur binding region domain-containing protein [Frankia tisae]|uniref:NADH-ubiquinone oxidoreductase-F iron-sulfur binding region domain-containing protein n=1 Tax=Frankia tisae TaxID=2950104 RepID=UPI0021BE2BB7|nr:NADH-ubiquinone oxidoreductase-F iron-sulfur binding region domain-containing protein [Frankia tisae]
MTVEHAVSPPIASATAPVPPSRLATAAAPRGPASSVGAGPAGRERPSHERPDHEPWPAGVHRIRTGEHPPAGPGITGPGHAVKTVGDGGDGGGAQRLLAAAAADLGSHYRRCGPVPWRGPGGHLLAEIRDSGLTGRGGAAFPTWRKLSAVAAAAHPDTGRLGGRRRAAPGGTRRPGTPVVVANAAEGEPESAKDATLLVAAAHLVLDGLQLAAEAVGAGEAYVHVKPGAAAQSVRRAVAERRAAGWDRCQIEVREAPATFLAGEASAVVAALEGAPARPRAHWRPLADDGLHGRPTLVHNVETLAHLAMIARWGAAWFRSVGTADEPGTLLVTVTGTVAAPGVVEVPYGTPLGDLLGLRGGAVEPVGALRLGGYAGTWLPVEVGPQVAMSRAGLAPWGAEPGPGIVSVLPAGACGLAETARIVAYLAAQNAGQCGPCVSGLPQLARSVAGMARVAGPDTAPDGENPAQAASRALRLAALVSGRGACHHPDGAARLVHSALRTFAADIRAHAQGHCLGSAHPS